MESEKCPCGEKAGGGKWHARRGQDTCEAAKIAKREYDKERHKTRPRVKRDKNYVPKYRRTWVPGSDIEIPEYDPL